jgi:DNA-nicking Smr family endonuclease
MATKPKRKPQKKKRSFTNRPLAGLSKLKPAQGVQAGKAKKKKSAVSDTGTRDESKEFLAAMSDVDPMPATGKPRKVKSRKVEIKPSDDQEAREVMQALRDLVEGEAPLSIHETDEAIEGAMEGLDPRILARLREGEFSIQDHLDLHGYNREEARSKVESFLLNAMAQDKRCVLVIHGRGHGSKDHIPVLKNALKSWFTRRALRKKILAFTTARQCDGGAGAVYVLLKKFRSR